MFLIFVAWFIFIEHEYRTGYFYVRILKCLKKLKEILLTYESAEIPFPRPLSLALERKFLKGFWHFEYLSTHWHSANRETRNSKKSKDSFIVILREPRVVNGWLNESGNTHKIIIPPIISKIHTYSELALWSDIEMAQLPKIIKKT